MPGPFTLGQIASRLGGRVAGDSQVLIRQVGSLERAGAEQIAFFNSKKLQAKLTETRAAAVILAPENERLTKLPRIVADSKVGETVDVVVMRGGKRTNLKLKVGELEDSDKQQAAVKGGKAPAPKDADPPGSPE